MFNSQLTLWSFLPIKRSGRSSRNRTEPAYLSATYVRTVQIVEKSLPASSIHATIYFHFLFDSSSHMAKRLLRLLLYSVSSLHPIFVVGDAYVASVDAAASQYLHVVSLRCPVS